MAAIEIQNYKDRKYFIKNRMHGLSVMEIWRHVLSVLSKYAYLGEKHIVFGVESTITMALSHDGSSFFFFFFGGPLQGMNNNGNMYNEPLNRVIMTKNAITYDNVVLTSQLHNNYVFRVSILTIVPKVAI